MLRDKSLIPLSRQHQHALALCVRIDRAQPIRVADLETWQVEIERHFEQEIKIHFSAEEEILFPIAGRFAELRPVADELITDHAALRESFSHASARCMSPEEVPVFAQRLAAHIRKEERRFFERLQQLLSTGELAELGRRLEAALQESSQTCVLPNHATMPGRKIK